MSPLVLAPADHDIDSLEKLRSATNNAPIQLVVNSALCQCDARDGFYGKGVKVMEIALEDDPDPRKYFDQGKPCTANCTDPNVPLVNRFPGEAIKDFDAVSKAVEATIASGGHALIHCHASLSRSVAFILAHLMRTRGLSLLGAAQVMKPKWDAVWPCDRFVDQLRTYEQQLSTPYRFTTKGLVALCVGNMLAGAVVVYALKK